MSSNIFNIFSQPERHEQDGVGRGFRLRMSAGFQPHRRCNSPLSWPLAALGSTGKSGRRRSSRSRLSRRFSMSGNPRSRIKGVRRTQLYKWRVQMEAVASGEGPPARSLGRESSDGMFESLLWIAFRELPQRPAGVLLDDRIGMFC